MCGIACRDLISYFRNFFKKAETMSWQEEKKRLAGLSKEERRKEYFCKDEFVKLEEVDTWKKANPKTVQDPERVESLKEKLITQDMNMDLDLSEKVSIYEGDITKLEIDGIVNAANNSLLGGGGVDGVIHRAAGENLLAENRTLGGCPYGEARLSGGYKLPAKYVISTVGPRGEHPDILENAYSNCLKMMLDNKLRSIAFPCISTGIYGYPNGEAANVALKTTRTFLEKHHEDVDRVIFCLFLQKDMEIYGERMPIIFPAFVEDANKEADTFEKNETQEAKQKSSNPDPEDAKKEAGTSEKSETQEVKEKSADPEEENKSSVDADTGKDSKL